MPLRACLCPWGQVSDARTPVLKFKIELDILVLKSSRLGENYLVISDIVVPKTKENSSAIHLAFSEM